MDERKIKKTPDGHSKSPRASHRRSDHSARHDSPDSKAKATHRRSKSRSQSREEKRRHDELPSHRRNSTDRRQQSSSRYESSHRSTRHRSRSPPSPGDSRRHYDVIEGKPSRVLGVFGLSLYTDERVLKEVFSQYGPVEDIQVILDHHSGVSRGFAFIYMRHLDDAIQAKELAPGTEIDGRKIRIDFSVTDFSPSPNAAGYVGRPVYSQPYRNSHPAYRSTRHSPATSREHFYGNGSRNYRGRSRSYSPRRF